MEMQCIIPDEPAVLTILTASIHMFEYAIAASRQLHKQQGTFATSSLVRITRAGKPFKVPRMVERRKYLTNVRALMYQEVHVKAGNSILGVILLDYLGQ